MTTGAPTRAHLKSLVRQYLDAMRSHGLTPNRTVAIDSIPRSASLIDEPEPQAMRRRYLLLDDGDAWCETVHGAQPVGSGLENSYHWLAALTPALSYALDRSIDDARDGGDGFLIAVRAAGAVYAVSDRRARPRR